MSAQPTALMAIGCYGTRVDGIDPKRPRSDLLERLGATSCQKQYRDDADGNAIHTGYIVRGEWFTLYEVRPWERKES